MSIIKNESECPQNVLDHIAESKQVVLRSQLLVRDQLSIELSSQNTTASLKIADKEFYNTTYALSCNKLSEIIDTADILIKDFLAVLGDEDVVAFRQPIECLETATGYMVLFRAAIVNRGAIE